MARLLVTVFALFGILVNSLLGTFALTEVKTLQALCERIRQDPKSVTLQALSPLGSQLHLVAWDVLYTVPFTGETIDSVCGKMTINGTDSGTRWTQVPWLKQAVYKIGSQIEPVLVSLNIFVNAKGNQEHPDKTHKIHIIYKNPNSSLGQVYINPKSNTSPPIVLYAAVATGALGPKAPGSEYMFADYLAGKMLVHTGKGAAYPILAPDNQSLVFEKRKKNFTEDQHTLRIRLPGFGFIHSGVVHLWDLEHGQVILFDSVDLQTQEGQNVPIRYVPFKDYLVCSDKDGGYVDEQDKVDFGAWWWFWFVWWFLGIFLLVVVILGGLGFRYYKFCKEKKKIAKKSSTMASSSSSISSKASKTKSSSSIQDSSSGGSFLARSKTKSTTPTSGSRAGSSLDGVHSSEIFSKMFATSKTTSSAIQNSGSSVGSLLKKPSSIKSSTITSGTLSKKPKTVTGYKKIDGPHFVPKGKKQ